MSKKEIGQRIRDLRIEFNMSKKKAVPSQSMVIWLAATIYESYTMGRRISRRNTVCFQENKS